MHWTPRYVTPPSVSQRIGACLAVCGHGQGWRHPNLSPYRDDPYAASQSAIQSSRALSIVKIWLGMLEITTAGAIVVLLHGRRCRSATLKLCHEFLIGPAQACSILDELNDIGVTAPALARTCMCGLGNISGC